MALGVITSGNESRMVRSLPQLKVILEDPTRRFNLDKSIEQGLNEVTPLEMMKYLQAKVKEIETMV